jgi:hypothetical protein
MNLFSEIKPLYEEKYFFSIIWALILSANFITVSFFFAGERNIRRYIHNTFNADIIREFNEVRKDTDYSVIMLGNSRLRYAVSYGLDPNEIVKLPNGKTVAVLKFATNAARFDIYDADVSYRVLKSEPDLIIVQDSVISNAPSEFKSMIVYSKTVLEFFVKSIRGISQYDEWLRDRKDVWKDAQCFKKFTKEGLDIQLQFNADRDRHSIDEENPGYKAAMDFFMQSRLSGQKIAVLRIPPNLEVLNKMDVPVHKTDFYGLEKMPSLEELLGDEREGVAWINDPPEFSEKQYCDYVHLNSKGREVFGDWLLEELQKLL